MRFVISGHEEYAVLNLVPVEDSGRGVELPMNLYTRWTRARAELDAAQRQVLAHLRSAGGSNAIPEELWESVDRTEEGGPSSAGWDSW
jgi:hypothetical protein